MSKTYLTVRIEGVEKDVLKKYCQSSGRTQSDVIREYVRTLKPDTVV